MRANADIKAENPRLWFPPTPKTGLGFPGMLNSYCSWVATKRDFCILPHALWLSSMLDKPRNTWLELEHKNGNSNKKHDHCSSRDFHLSQINTWKSTFQKLPSQHQVSQMIWVTLSCCHMFYSMTNGHKTPQTSNILQKNILVQAHRHSKAISRTDYKTTTGREANLRLCLREIRICSTCPAWKVQEAEPVPNPHTANHQEKYRACDQYWQFLNHHGFCSHEELFSTALWWGVAK